MRRIMMMIVTILLVTTGLTAEALSNYRIHANLAGNSIIPDIQERITALQELVGK